MECPLHFCGTNDCCCPKLRTKIVSPENMTYPNASDAPSMLLRFPEIPKLPMLPVCFMLAIVLESVPSFIGMRK